MSLNSACEVYDREYHTSTLYKCQGFQLNSTCDKSVVDEIMIDFIEQT